MQQLDLMMVKRKVLKKELMMVHLLETEKVNKLVLLMVPKRVLLMVSNLVNMMEL